MEFEGAKRCFNYLKSAGISILVFISDRHKGISKWTREKEPNRKHFYDIWHMAKSVTKRFLKASKKKSCEVLNAWVKEIDTKSGFEAIIEAKWMSVIYHVADKHHPDELFTTCIHDEIQEPRDWIYPGMIM